MHPLFLRHDVPQYLLHGSYSSEVRDCRRCEPLLITWLRGIEFGSASQQLTEHLRDEYSYYPENVR